MLCSIIDLVGGWLKYLLSGRPHPFPTVFAEDPPDELRKNTVYILGQGEYLWSAVMLCPCGCGEVLHMSLHEDGRPRWHLTCHSDGTVSLQPSIRRTCGCHSHFFFVRGCVIWCEAARADVSAYRRARRHRRKLGDASGHEIMPLG